ncbi:MAG: AAA family ATPase [Actinobacteria bacterium]|nr:AAA family ATPase [Actinomycetota bacterium]
MTRPRVLVVVAGTATEIGKTWVGGRTLEHLGARGVAVAARKPAQSFDPEDPAPTDAEVLGAASGEDPSTVCPAHRCYEVALAPPMAADVLGRPAPMVDDLIDELRWPDPAVDLGWLETVGGPRSPIAEDADAVVLAELVEPDVVVLVADAGLGTINAVLVSVAAFAGFGVVVVLNRFDPADDLHVRNLRWLRTREGLDVVTDAEALADSLVQRIG